MRAWSAPDVPTLDRQGPAVRVFDTARQSVVATDPGPEARIYVCGITPYDATHMGHAATYVSFDLLVRAWQNAGHRVRYVQNVTDVDEPLLERADAVNVDWRALAERETQLFREDMHALRVLPPEAFIGAVESIPLVLDLIAELRDRGAVYELDGDLYFRVAADPSFGSVSGWERDRMAVIFGERGGDPQRPGKEDPLDCLVWLAERPGEPAWDSPFGRGRPGWHIECTAIAGTHLGGAIDVQGGGSDLIFPHHEMSAAEAQAAHPQVPFAKAYVHVGMVGLDGEKMSKSKGNLVFVSHLRNSEIDPMAIRLTLLGHHYRTEWEWQADELWQAVDRLAG
ncbi:MAG: cysteine--1-D-myo-inosityl 2-amino-2-deoxy-alpha-D-glucopyranoside ligase, partial [Nocardioides sp.]